MGKRSVLYRYLSNRFILFSGSSKRREVFLTFDDGPFPENTGIILDTLKKYDVKATFFLSGGSVVNDFKTVERIIQEGHDAGNHFFDHKRIDRISYRELSQQILSCEKTLLECGARQVDFIRPPYGTINVNLLRYCLANKKRLIMWSYDCKDTFIKSEDEIECFKKKFTIEPGEIFLLHDDSMYIKDMLEWIIREARGRGLSFSKISEL
ncbi:MAG: polysaccharide deacetylase family protein [Nitrospirae bacterium]|nr:polysaccharide deacetylase family protein [Nitrospirota bacterium]